MSSGRGRGRWRVAPTAINPGSASRPAGRRPARGGRGARPPAGGASLAGLLLLAAASVLPSGAEAQAPDEAWRTLETEHFRVTFPEHLEAVGRKAGDRAERAWEQLSTHFIEPPDTPVDLLVTDHADVSNGFAQITPSNRITVFARPPVDALALGFADEWLELVITHELAHIVHLDHVVNPIGRLSRAVLGRVPGEWPFFPGLSTPRWVTEGLATWYESRLTEAGRVRGSFLDMQIRTAMLEGRFESIAQASGDSPVWPGGNRSYAYGSLFFEYLLEKHGEERMEAFVHAVAGQWIPYRLDAAARDAFGVSFSEEWSAWSGVVRKELDRLDTELERLGPVSEPERLTRQARWALYPSVSPDGRWVAYTRSDGRSDMQIRLLDPTTGESRSLGRTNQLATFSWIDDGRLLVSQLELEGPYSYYHDLYVFDLDGGQRRLTRGARLTQPSVVPGGDGAIVVREGEGTNELVRVDLASGDATTVVEADPEVHWAFPSVSPDGRWIAVTRFEPNARHDVVILDARSGEIVERVTDDRAVDMAPRWSSDGAWLVWGSDRTGILNVHGAQVDAGDGSASAPVLLSNVRTGAAFPSLDPADEWIYLSGHHVDGWEIERLPFRPAARSATPPLAERFVLDAEVPQRGRADGEVEPYSAGPTLRPYYWELSYRAPLVTPRIVTDSLSLRRRELLGHGIGIQTSGRDLVGRHAYAAAVRATTGRTKVEGSAAYSFAGLGNPVLSLSVGQRYEDGGQQVARPDPGAPLDTLFLLRREHSVEGSVTFLAPSWRRNLAVTLSGGFDWEHRELLGADLEPSTEYRLTRPQSRLSDVSASFVVNSARSHSFQMGTSAGASLFALGRIRNELALPDSLSGVRGVDRSTREVIGRVRGAIPLWRGGYARHVLAFHASGGVAGGPGADVGHYRVGGASGRPEPITGLELFGGDSFFFPVRGYEPSSRFGRYAWTASAEYRIPLWLINRAYRAWPLHLDRMMASLFFDAGNAWGPDVSVSGFPNTLQLAIASVGVELTSEILALYDTSVTLRGGVAMPLVAATVAAGRPRFYVRVGLPY